MTNNKKESNGDSMHYDKTDFADETLSSFKNHDNYTIKTKNYGKVTLTHVEILKKNRFIQKDVGNYISIDFETLNDEKDRIHISDVLLKALHSMYKISKKDRVLIVGLGNSEIVADSLGPSVAEKIIVTNHLFKLFPSQVDKDLRRVSVFTPKVMGQTGLESSDLIKAIAKLYNPTLIIAIDSLASSSVKRINKVIQINDSGIRPGSGIGNHRKPLNQQVLKVPIIAIGVATVVSAQKIVEEALFQYSKKTNAFLPKEKENQILNQILTNQSLNMVVTPKEIDEDVHYLSTIIATSLNKFIHHDCSRV